MVSAVLILPVELKTSGDLIGSAMGWGPESYTIPLSTGDVDIVTHMGLRSEADPSFAKMIQDAQAGIYPPELPESVVGPVISALIYDFSPDSENPDKPILWGSEHLDSVLSTNSLVRC